MTSLAHTGSMPRRSFFSRFGMKPLLAMMVAIATISAAMTISSSEAEARNRGRTAALIGVGIVGALALGALASRHGHVYADDGYYHQPRHHRRLRHRFVETGFNDGIYIKRRPRCQIRTVRTYDDWGNTYRQRVRLCR